MKKNGFSLVLILFSVFWVISCNDSKDHVQKDQASIDPYDKWFFDNRDLLENISREELIRYDIRHGKAIYRNVTPKKRYEFWSEKFQKMKVQSANSLEQNHYAKMIEFLSPSLFDSLIDNRDKILQFQKEWVSYAKQHLKWDENKIAIVSESLFLPEEYQAIQEENLNKVIGRYIEDDEKKCVCAWDVWCYIATGGEYYYCEDDNCRRTSKGCGFLYQFACTSYCSD
ncbi:MAG: bacteriocin fulvocin C-related protein [Saprospiraceae bacterium]|nr:bacteriocin fulvocin C-related protein [Saprospiraceae bacterium]